MSGFSFGLEPPDWWEHKCTKHNAFFQSLGWQSMLEKAFSCRTLYGWHENAESGFAITNFRAGPFRIGYLGFPVGGSIGTSVLDQKTLHAWNLSRNPHAPHCIRIPVSAFSGMPGLQLPFLENPETAITDLQGWGMDSVSKKLRRDIRKARNTELTLADGEFPDQGRIMYVIYRDTVKQHGGVLRYNEAYFKGLVSLARTNPGLRCLFAMLKDEIAGFVVVCRHGDTAYYLHGGTNSLHRRHNPSDLLLYEAITWASQIGSRCFNLMASPEKQLSLVRYKEKWGGITKRHRTYTCPVNGPACMAFRWAEKLYRLVH
jgi:hypothetical protein